MSDQIQSTSRRDAVRRIALALTAAGSGSLTADAAQHVHEAAAAEKQNGPYKPKAFTAHEWAVLRKLAALIVPADAKSGSALDAGAPEFIDLLSSQNPKLAGIFHGGIAWLDGEMHRRFGKEFVDAAEARQTEMLDALVAAERVVRERESEELSYVRGAQYRNFSTYTTRPGTDLAAGAQFLDWVRKLTVDAYYTSPIGIKDLNYLGNGARTKYDVPAAVLRHIGMA